MLKNGEKFTHNDEIYTVFAHEGNMSEVFKNGRFWAWPSWNGISPVIINFIKDGTQGNTTEHIRASI